MTSDQEDKKESSKRLSRSLHPLSIVTSELLSAFTSRGFVAVTGPEIVTEKENFDVLNFPPYHPARDEHDTYWLKDVPNGLLRTQTSSSQVSHLKAEKGRGFPIKLVVPGQTYRNEATDATHEIQFHQLEGIAVGKRGEITLVTLKSTLDAVFNEFFEKETGFRIRPGYFPFVEPGVEMDVFFNGKWLELGGAGMIHPQVLRNADIDPEKYAGYAFGIGIDRLLMIRYGVDDIRLLSSGDLRFSRQLTKGE